MVEAEDQANRLQEAGYVRCPGAREFVVQVGDVLAEFEIFPDGGVQPLFQMQGVFLEHLPGDLFRGEVAQSLREVGSSFILSCACCRPADACAVWRRWFWLRCPADRRRRSIHRQQYRLGNARVRAELDVSRAGAERRA